MAHLVCFQASSGWLGCNGRFGSKQARVCLDAKRRLLGSKTAWAWMQVAGCLEANDHAYGGVCRGLRGSAPGEYTLGNLVLDQDYTFVKVNS